MSAACTRSATCFLGSDFAGVAHATQARSGSASFMSPRLANAPQVAGPFANPAKVREMLARAAVRTGQPRAHDPVGRHQHDEPPLQSVDVDDRTLRPQGRTARIDDTGARIAPAEQLAG